MAAILIKRVKSQRTMEKRAASKAPSTKQERSITINDQGARRHLCGVFFIVMSLFYLFIFTHTNRSLCVSNHVSNPLVATPNQPLLISIVFFCFSLYMGPLYAQVRLRSRERRAEERLRRPRTPSHSEVNSKAESHLSDPAKAKSNFRCSHYND